MDAEPNLTQLARTLGDASRIRMLAMLMDGRALTAKELAYAAQVDPATATSHLKRLQRDGIVTVAAQSRFKFFRLASPDVARLVESLMVVAPQPAGGSAQRREADPIRVARYCYDHLAGQLGTGLADVWTARGLLAGDGEKALKVTRAGAAWLSEFGVDLSEVRRKRRHLAYRCLDWSERRDHLGGALGAALADRIAALGWIDRLPDSRAVRITAAGARALARDFGLTFPRGS